MFVVGNVLERPREDANAVAQQGAVGGVVHVAFDHRRIGAQFIAVRHAFLYGQADYALMNLFRHGGTQQRKAAAEGGEIGRNLGVEVGEATVHQVAAQPGCRNRNQPRWSLERRV